MAAFPHRPDSLPKTEVDPSAHFHPTNPEVSEQIFENEHFTVQTIPLVHGVPCTGFLFRDS